MAAEVIKCIYKDEKSLYAAYMSFVRGGGLFIRTTKNYDLGCKLRLIVKLLDDEETDEIEGKIIWLTPKGAQRNKPAGIGVQLCGEIGHTIANKIETSLAGMLESSQPTDTI